MFSKRKKKTYQPRKIFSSLQFITQMILMIKKSLTNIYLLFIHKFRKILFLSGQDMNASLGVRTDKKDIVGNHGLKKRNMKGEEALNLLRSHKFYASSTFFDHKYYTTWKSFDGLNKSFQLDHWITNSLSIIKDAKVIDYGVPSDHSAIILILKFPKEKKEGRKTTTNIDWNVFLEEDTKLAFNKFLIRN